LIWIFNDRFVSISVTDLARSVPVLSIAYTPFVTSVVARLISSDFFNRQDRPDEWLFVAFTSYIYFTRAR
jgi:hypothetical protein